jgi:SPOR domain
VSRARFGLLLALLVLVVGTASFLGVYTLLDDSSGTPPGGPDTTASPTTAAPATTTTTTTLAPGTLATPTFVVVVTSEADEGTAQGVRDDLTEAGYTAGVLHSDDYQSLSPGFWVSYVGPFDDLATAEATKAQLIADGYDAAYSRCVGTSADCP